MKEHSQLLQNPRGSPDPQREVKASLQQDLEPLEQDIRQVAAMQPKTWHIQTAHINASHKHYYT